MNNPIKISIILILPQTNFWGVRYCFDQLGLEYKKREKVTNEEEDSFANFIDGIEVELNVIEHAGTDDKFSQYFMPIADNFYHYQSHEDWYIKNTANNIYSYYDCSHICILHPFMLLKNGWLSELLSYNQMIEKSGLTCIAKDLKKKNITSFTDSEKNFVHVYEHEDNYVDGVFMFSKELFDKLGLFAKNLHGLEFNQYAYRSTACGFLNFYLPNTFSIETTEPEPIPVEAYEKFDLSIEEMITNKSWKL